MKIAIAGTGYVGLVSGACLADLGHHVVCIDRDEARVDGLRNGVMPIFEPGLDEMVGRNVAAGRLTFQLGFQAFDEDLDAVFVAVGTPPSPTDGSADLTAVFTVANEIAANARGPLTIVTKSTVPVGTGDRVEAIVKKARPDVRFDVVSNPEFLREGSAIQDFLQPDRIVVGSQSPEGFAVLDAVYRPLADKGAPIVQTSRRSAEVIKYGANGFLAAKIAYINEMSDLCEATGASIADVAIGMGLDRRIGRDFLACGPGFGGSCFPKDTEALLATAHNHGVQMRLVESTITANEARKRSMGNRVTAAMGGDVAGKTVAVLGLAFKANTDDTRQSPALSVVFALLAGGADVRVYDPEGMKQSRQTLNGSVVYAEDAYDCTAGAHAVVVATDWSEFSLLDFSRVAAAMADDVLVDLRNCLPPEIVQEAGLRLFRLGERKVRTTTAYGRRRGDLSLVRPAGRRVV